MLLDAYTRAATRITEHRPDCEGLRWQILAAIGKVESDHAAGHDLAPDGTTTPPITGPRLDGSGAGGNTTPHHDTDHGHWDGDTAFDRAVGPMQFLPATWQTHGLDATGTGEADPHNAYDAALSAAAYLCGTGDTDLTDTEQLDAAIYRYNRSRDYVENVHALIDHYDTPPPSTPAGDEAGSDAGQAAVQWALQQVGKPYAWGGTGPETFDCSGLTQQAWAHAGVTIPRVTTDQYNAATPVEVEHLQPGDLLFYDTTDTGAPGPPPSHVTMYIGDGQMINAPSTGQTIRTQPVESDYYTPRLMGARRPVEIG